MGILKVHFNMKRFLFPTSIILIPCISLFADNEVEVFDGCDVSNRDFSGISHINSSWIGSTAIGTMFSDSQYPADYTNSNFKEANLTDAYFINATLASVSFINANLTNTNFSDTNLSDADFTDSIIT